MRGQWTYNRDVGKSTRLATGSQLSEMPTLPPTTEAKMPKHGGVEGDRQSVKRRCVMIRLDQVVKRQEINLS